MFRFCCGNRMTSCCDHASVNQVRSKFQSSAHAHRVRSRERVKILQVQECHAMEYAPGVGASFQRLAFVGLGKSRASDIHSCWNWYAFVACIALGQPVTKLWFYYVSKIWQAIPFISFVLAGIALTIRRFWSDDYLHSVPLSNSFLEMSAHVFHA